MTIAAYSNAGFDRETASEPRISFFATTVSTSAARLRSFAAACIGAIGYATVGEAVGVGLASVVTGADPGGRELSRLPSSSQKSSEFSKVLLHFAQRFMPVRTDVA